MDRVVKNGPFLCKDVGCVLMPIRAVTGRSYVLESTWPFSCSGSVASLGWK
jgi:hypothetical protein